MSGFNTKANQEKSLGAVVLFVHWLCLAEVYVSNMSRCFLYALCLLINSVHSSWKSLELEDG